MAVPEPDLLVNPHPLPMLPRLPYLFSEMGPQPDRQPVSSLAAVRSASVEPSGVGRGPAQGQGQGQGQVQGAQAGGEEQKTEEQAQWEADPLQFGSQGAVSWGDKLAGERWSERESQG